MNTSELHPVLEKILSQPGNPDATPVEKQTPGEARAEFEADIAAVDGPAPDVAAVEDIAIPGPGGTIAARLYRPHGLGERPALMVYYHGGGNIRGSLASHDSTCRVLADAGKLLVLSVDYRLAPEHPFPAAAEDAVAALEWAAANATALGADGARLVVGGDSAGGNLAAAVCLHARDNDGPAIAAQMLIYPVIDHVNDYPSTRAYSKGYMLDSMPFYRASYLPDPARRTDPLASPICAETLAGLPPAMVLTAGFDPLRDEGCAYAERLRQDRVTIDQVNYPSMIHGFTLLRGLLPEADLALADAIQRTLALADR